MTLKDAIKGNSQSQVSDKKNLSLKEAIAASNGSSSNTSFQTLSDIRREREAEELKKQQEELEAKRKEMVEENRKSTGLVDNKFSFDVNGANNLLFNPKAPSKDNNTAQPAGIVKPSTNVVDDSRRTGAPIIPTYTDDDRDENAIANLNSQIDSLKKRREELASQYQTAVSERDGKRAKEIQDEMSATSNSIDDASKRAASIQESMKSRQDARNFLSDVAEQKVKSVQDLYNNTVYNNINNGEAVNVALTNSVTSFAKDKGAMVGKELDDYLNKLKNHRSTEEIEADIESVENDRKNASKRISDLAYMAQNGEISQQEYLNKKAGIDKLYNDKITSLRKELTNAQSDEFKLLPYTKEFQSFKEDEKNTGVKLVIPSDTKDIKKLGLMVMAANDPNGYLTSEEKDIFNYLLVTKGAEEAEKYAKIISPEVNARQRAGIERDFGDWSSQNVWTGAAGTVAAALASSLKFISAAGQLSDYAKDGQIDENAPYNFFSYAPKSVVQAVSQKLTLKYGDTAAELYQTAYSVAQSMINAGIGAGITKGLGVTGEAANALISNITLSLMATQVFPDTVLDCKAKGMSDDQAVALGMVNAATEVLTEKLPLDNFLDKKLWNKPDITKILGQMASEGAEELVSGLVEPVAELLASKNHSELMATYNEYLAQTGDPEEAKKLTIQSLFLDAGKDGLYGALSAVMHVGIAYGANVATMPIRKALSDSKSTDKIVKSGKSDSVFSALKEVVSSDQKNWKEPVAKLVSEIDSAVGGKANAINKTVDFLNEQIRNDAPLSEAYKKINSYIKSKENRSAIEAQLETMAKEQSKSEDSVKTDTKPNTETVETKNENVENENDEELDEDYDKAYKQEIAERLGVEYEGDFKKLVRDVEKKFNNNGYNLKNALRNISRDYREDAEAIGFINQIFNESSREETQRNVNVLNNILPTSFGNKILVDENLEVDFGSGSLELAYWDNKTRTAYVSPSLGSSGSIIYYVTHEFGHQASEEDATFVKDVTELRNKLTDSGAYEDADFDTMLGIYADVVANGNLTQDGINKINNYAMENGVTFEQACVEIAKNDANDFLDNYIKDKAKAVDYVNEEMNSVFLSEVLGKGLHGTWMMSMSHRERTLVGKIADFFEKLVARIRKTDTKQADALKDVSSAIRSALNQYSAVKDVGGISEKAKESNKPKPTNKQLAESISDFQKKHSREFVSDHLDMLQKQFDSVRDSLSDAEIAEYEEMEKNYLKQVKMWDEISEELNDDFLNKWNKQTKSDKRFTFFKAQSGYKYNGEIASMCAKGIPLFEAIDTIVQRDVIDKLKSKRIGAVEKQILYDMLRENGLPIPCAICYVEQARRREGEVIDAFLNGKVDTNSSGEPTKTKLGWNQVISAIEEDMKEAGVDFKFPGMPKEITTSNYSPVDTQMTEEESEAFFNALVKECNKELKAVNDASREFNRKLEEKKARGEEVKDKKKAIRPLLKDASPASVKSSLKGSISSNLKIFKTLFNSPSSRFRANSNYLYSSITTKNLFLNHGDFYSLFNSQGGTGGYKSKQSAIAYLGDILGKKWGSDTLRKNGGMRNQSNSDFQMYAYLDHVQVFMDLAAKGYYLHGYTKVVEELALFGLCNGKYNASLIPKVKEYYVMDNDGNVARDEKGEKIVDVETTMENAGLDENGEPIYDDIEGINHIEAFAYLDDENYSKSIAGICIGYSYKHIAKLLDENRVQLIIGFHDKTNDGEKRYRGARYAHNFNGENEAKSKSGETEHIGFNQFVLAAEKMLGFNPETGVASKGTVTKKFAWELEGKEYGVNDIPRLAQNLYLEYCGKVGEHEYTKYTPAYEMFSNHSNYYKLLADFGLYDSKGNYAPQKKVKLNIPDKVWSVDRNGNKTEISSKDMIKNALSRELEIRNKTAELLSEDGDGGFLNEFVETANEMYDQAQYNEQVAKAARKHSLEISMGTFFSGGGLVDFGLREVAQSALAVEKDELISRAFRLNNGEVITDLVQNVNLDDYVGKIDYFHASPVCKDYSRMNRNRKKVSDGVLDMKTAEATADAIEKLQPKAFTLEQVPEYAGSNALKIITDRLEKLGYKIQSGVFNAYEYGGATKRERFLLMACKDGKFDTPKKTKGYTWYEATYDLIDSLPELEKNPNWILERLSRTPELEVTDKPVLFLGGTNGGKAWFANSDEPCPSITTDMHDARIFMPDGRILKCTPRFFARVMGLPDSYNLGDIEYDKKAVGNVSNATAYKVVGNGVPVQLTQKFFGNFLNAQFDTGVKFSREAHNKSTEGFVTDYFDEGTPEREFLEVTKSTIEDITGNTFSGQKLRDFFKNNPELDFVQRMHDGDKSAKADLEKFVSKIKDSVTLDKVMWYPAKVHWTSEYKGARTRYMNVFKKAMENLGSGRNWNVEHKEYSLFDVTKMFNENNTNKDIAELSNKVFSVAKELGVNIYFTNGGVVLQAESAGTTWGRNVAFYRNYFNSKRYSDQSKAETILHELIHSCTVYAMVNKSKLTNQRMIDAVNDIEEIYNQIKKSPTLVNEYGITESREMMAELSNVTFREKLQKVSLWGRVVSAIKKFFGLDNSDQVTLDTTDALSGATYALETLLDNYDKTVYDSFASTQEVYIKDAIFRTGKNKFSRENSRNASKEDSDYMDAVFDSFINPSEESTNKMSNIIKSAATKAGFKVPVFHGTARFGFTVADTSKSDDKLSFFATDSNEVADTYSYDAKTRTIAGSQSLINIRELKDSNGSWRNDSSVLRFLDKYGIEYLVSRGTNSKGESTTLVRVPSWDGNNSSVNAEMHKKFNGEYKDVSKELSKKYGRATGNYSFYANTDGMKQLDCKGKKWNELTLPMLESSKYAKWVKGTRFENSPVTTRSYSQFIADTTNATGVIFKNVVDDGGRGMSDAPSANVYNFFNPQSQLKSADAITYDNDGNIILPSERFNPKIPDFRFSRESVENEYANNDDLRHSSEDVVAQGYTSSDTSRPQVAALFKNKNVVYGKTNIDIGGGKYDFAKNYLADMGVKSMIFDPYNRDEAENSETLQFLTSGKKADTSTCANVLNVIDSEAARANVILECAKSIKDDGTSYFTVYEGDKTGTGKRTSDGWQNNRRTETYVDEISKYYDNVERKGALIIAKNPKPNLPSASWETSVGNVTRWSREYNLGDDGDIYEDDEGNPLFAINVRSTKSEPFADWIADGFKTIETRHSDVLKKLVGHRVGICKTGNGKRTIVAYATISESKAYNNVDEFNQDADKHLVGDNSKFKFTDKKVGYVLTDVTKIEPFEVNKYPGNRSYRRIDGEYRSAKEVNKSDSELRLEAANKTIARLQRNLMTEFSDGTPATKITRAEIERLVDSIGWQYENVPKSTVANALEKLYSQYGKEGFDIVSETRKVAEELYVKSYHKVEREDWQLIQELRSKIRGAPNQRLYVDPQYWGDFAKEDARRLRATIKATSHEWLMGRSVDDIYDELNGLAPQYFPEVWTVQERIVNIANILDDSKYGRWTGEDTDYEWGQSMVDEDEHLAQLTEQLIHAYSERSTLTKAAKLAKSAADSARDAAMFYQEANLANAETAYIKADAEMYKSKVDAEYEANKRALEIQDQIIREDLRKNTERMRRELDKRDVQIEKIQSRVIGKEISHEVTFEYRKAVKNLRKLSTLLSNSSRVNMTTNEELRGIAANIDLFVSNEVSKLFSGSGNITGGNIARLKSLADNAVKLAKSSFAGEEFASVVGDLYSRYSEVLDEMSTIAEAINYTIDPQTVKYHLNLKPVDVAHLSDEEKKLLDENFYYSTSKKKYVSKYSSKDERSEGASYLLHLLGAFNYSKKAVQNIAANKRLEALRYLNGIVSATVKAINDTNSIFINGKKEEVRVVADKMFRQLKKTEKIFNKKGNAIGGETLSMQTPWQYLPNIFGEYGTELVKELSDRQSEMMSFQQEFVEYMSDLLNGYDTWRSGLKGEKIEIDVKGYIQDSLFEETNDGKSDVMDEISKADREEEETPDNKEETSENENTEPQEEESKLIERKISVSKSQLMTLYALWGREAGRRHLTGGGASFLNEYGKEGDFRVVIDDETFEKLTGLLTEDEKRIALGIRDFLAGRCSEFGNNASREMFGFSVFEDPDYFPIEVSRYSISNNGSEDVDPFVRPYEVVNDGMTKSISPNASSAVRIGDIFNIASNHVRKMSIYGSYSKSALQLRKVMNIKSMRANLERGLGNAGYKTFSTLVDKIAQGNIEADQTNHTDFGLLSYLVKGQKAAAVMLNLSTMTKQPVSAIRALNVIDSKNLARAVADCSKKSEVEAIKETMRENGIATIKNLGYSEYGFAHTLQQRFDERYTETGELTSKLRREHENFDKAIKAVKTGKATETLLGGAEKADEFTWIRLWRACELQAIDRFKEDVKINPDISENEDNIIKKYTHDIFNEVIGKTQVVDSILTSSDKSQNKALKFLYPFQNEPWKDLGLTISLVQTLQLAESNEAKANARKALVKQGVLSFINTATVAVISSLFSMWRDDKDDIEDWGTFGASFLKHFLGIDIKGNETDLLSIITSDLFGGILTGTPALGAMIDDALATLQNFKSSAFYESALFELINSTSKLISNLPKDKKDRRESDAKLIFNMGYAVANLLGVPLRTVIRDSCAVYRVIINATDNYKLQWEYAKLWYNMENASARSQNEFYSILARAYKAGDLEAYQKMREDLNSLKWTTSSGVATKLTPKQVEEFVGKSLGYSEDEIPEEYIGTDVWNLDVQMRFNLPSAVPFGNVEKKLTELYRAKGDKSILPTSPSSSFSVANKDIKLNEVEYDKFLTDVGQMEYKLLTEMFSSSRSGTYSKLSFDQREYAVDKAYEYAKAHAKKKLEKKYKMDKWEQELYDKNAGQHEIISTILDMASKYEKKK